MNGKIRLVHRRDGMTAHDRVAVDAENAPLIGSKEIAEGRIALELRRADDDRHQLLFEDLFADLDRLADIADLGRGIECRADLVVADIRPQAFQPLEGRGKMFLHPGRALAAARSGNADGAAISETVEQCLIGNAEEEHGRDAIAGERFHHIGGAGEIVAVITDEQVAHPHAALPSPNLAIDAASSG